MNFEETEKIFAPVVVYCIYQIHVSVLLNKSFFIFTSSQYDPTIEDYYQKTVDIDGKAIEIEILDTAGQDAYSGIFSLCTIS